MRITEYELEYCRDRAHILTGLLPASYPGKPRVEFSADDLGVICQTFIGGDEVERSYVFSYGIAR